MENVKIIIDGIQKDVYGLFYIYNSKYYFIYTEKEIDENNYVILYMTQVGKETQNTAAGPVPTGYMIGFEITDPEEQKSVQTSISYIVEDKKNNTVNPQIQYLPMSMLTNFKVLSNKRFRLLKSIMVDNFKIIFDQTTTSVDSSSTPVASENVEVSTTLESPIEQDMAKEESPKDSDLVVAVDLVVPIDPIIPAALTLDTQQNELKTETIEGETNTDESQSKIETNNNESNSLVDLVVPINSSTIEKQAKTQNQLESKINDSETTNVEKQTESKEDALVGEESQPQLEETNDESTIIKDPETIESSPMPKKSENNVIIDYRTKYFEEEDKNKELQQQIEILTKKLEEIKKVIE